MKKIALISAYHTGSHARWATEYKQFSKHSIELFSLPGRHWKWRMYGAAITLAQELNQSPVSFDHIIVDDMLDLSLFKCTLNRKYQDVPLSLYFHENQLTYPWSSNDQDKKLNRDLHYGFKNIISFLLANNVYFNSQYHQSVFLESAEFFLKSMPDFPIDHMLKNKKSNILPIGIDLESLNQKRIPKNSSATILWNHRWEFDKNPEDFFQILIELSQEGLNFELVVLGKQARKTPAIFDHAYHQLKSHILHWGEVKSINEYAQWLWRTNILPVTSKQDFFGIAVIEAIHTQNIPLLPHRLVYPEYVSEENLYSDLSEFKNKLRALILGKTSLPTYSVEKFDWKNLVKKYDECFC